MIGDTSQKGSALPVIAAILIGVGLLFVSYSHFSGSSRQTRLETSAAPELDRIADLLVTFAKVNGRLPCPADATAGDGVEDCPTTSTPVQRRVVPWRTLGLSEALDPWSHLIGYRPVPTATAAGGLTGAAPAGLTVCTTVACGPTERETDIAFVLISHGVAGRGAYDSGGTIVANPANASEQANATGNGPYYAITRTSQSVTTAADQFDHILAHRPLSDVTTTPQQPDDECIPNVFGGGLATHGDGGITLDGSPNLNNLTSYTFTTKVLNKPSWYQYDSIKSQYAASGSASDTVPIPDAPAAPSNTSTEDYRAGPWPDVNRTLTGDQAFKSLTVTSGGSLTLDSTGNMTVNVREAVTLGPHWLKAEGDVTLHAGSFSLAGGHTATFKGAGNTVLNIHGNATLGGGGILNIEGDSFLYTKDLTISGGKGISVTGGGLTIIVDGDLTIGGADAIVAAPPASALILVKGDVTLQGSASAQAYIYADGDARMTGAARLNGSLVAKSILMNGSATLNYTTNVPKGVGDCD